MWKISLFSSRRNGAWAWLPFVLYLILDINTRSTINAASVAPSEGSCSSSQTCEGPNCNELGSCQRASSRASVEDNNCAFDAENGLCISSPEEMFRKCSPDDHCLPREDFGAFVVASPIYRSGIPGSCQNDPAEYCEEFAIEEHACLLNPNFMYDSCPKSCYICFENDIDDGSNISLVKVPIGMKQTMPLETTEEVKTRFYEVIAGTALYMTNEVFAKKDLEEARRDCRNNDDRCAWKVASTGGAFCDEPTSTKLCGPACKACGEIILTNDELEILDNCLTNYNMDIFENDKLESDDKIENDNDDFDDSQTLDAMFGRIVGELPYPSPSGEPYPIVPGVNYTVKVLSRPSLNPEIHTNISWNSIDFHIGGPWIVVLDDFLSPEECDRLIEIGDLLGRQKSTIHEDDDEINEEDQKDEDKDVSDNVAMDRVEEEEPEWRTSSTAWCDESCEHDPVASRVHERIGFTTGVTNEYFEDLQLLKYNPGEYYMEHHDEIGDVHNDKYLPRGPRILTFFLYLNDVEEGGETRFTDLMGDDSDIFLDVAPKKGRALLWPSMLNEDLLALDVRTYHEALEVKKGVKYGANVWMHLRDFKNYDICDEEAAEGLREKWDFFG